MHEFIQIITLLAVAIGVTGIAKLLKQPYSIALVVVGLILGYFQIPALDQAKAFITESSVFQLIIISIFLPTLLGEATLKLPISSLNENKKPIFALALGGTFISFLTIGLASYYLLDLPLQVAFTFAALMSATDPISVLSIFKTLGVNKRLTTIIEGESLFNDGIAVVLFKISSVYLLSYIAMGIEGAGRGVGLFLWFALGGLAVGGAFGYLFSQIVRFFDDYPYEIILVLIMLYGSFFFGEDVLHVSGVIAVVVSGLVLGNFGAKIGMGPVTRLNLNNTLDVLALIANSLIFLMVGLEITNIKFGDKWYLIIAAIFIVLLGRTIAVYTSMTFIKSIPKNWVHILNWGGLKGSLSIALVLSLPNNFPGKEDILALTFSVVVFSLLVQGLTIKTFISKLGIIKPGKGLEEYENKIAQLFVAEKSLEELDKMKVNKLISGTGYEQYATIYQNKISQFNEELKKLYAKYPQIATEQGRDVEKRLLYVQHDALDALVEKGVIDGKIAEQQKQEVLEQIENIELKTDE